MEMTEVTSQNLNTLYRLQRQLRTIDRTQSYSRNNVEKWLEEQKTQLTYDQNQYNMELQRIKRQIESLIGHESWQPQLPTSTLKNLADTCHLQLNRLLLRSKNLYSQLTKRSKRECQSFINRLEQIEEEINSRLVEQNKQLLLSLHQLRKCQERENEREDVRENQLRRRDQMRRQLEKKVDILERNYLEEVSLMNQQNIQLTERLEEVGRHLHTQIQQERQKTTEMFKKQYGRLEKCIKNIMDRGESEDD